MWYAQNVLVRKITLSYIHTFTLHNKMSSVDIVTSPPSAWVAAMRAMQQETSLKHFEFPLKHPRNILTTPFHFFVTPLKQTVKNRTTLKYPLK